MKTDQARQMNDLEKENQRLRPAVSDLTLDKQIPQEAASLHDEPFLEPMCWRRKS